MSAQISQSRACQLSRSELEETLRLAAHLTVGADDSTDSVGRALLTEAHVRGLVVDAPVRVAIPAKKREALLAGNPFVQAAVTSAMAAAAAAAAKSAGPSGSNKQTAAAGGGREAFTPTHRVGRVVALLPKPGTAANAVALSPADWLLAVDLGECTELFPLRAVAEDAFTDAEHQVYVQSAVGSGASNDNKGNAAILSGAQVEALKRRIMELRLALLVVLGVHSPSSGQAQSAPSDADLAQGRQRVADAMAAMAARRTAGAPVGASRKRSRGEAGDKVGDGEDASSEAGLVDGDLGENDNDNGDSSSSSRSNSSHIIQVQRLSETISRQSAQLQALRQLVQKKEADIAAALQAQLQSEQQHAAEVSQLRSKAEEEARARERSLRDSAEQLSKLELAGTKLRSVAQMAAKYKRVYDELVNSALGFTAEEAKEKKPEEVMELLRAKKSL